MNMKILVAIVIVALIGIAFASRMDIGEEIVTVTDGKATSTLQDVGDGTRTYSLAEVAAHNDGKSCYAAIDGSVYDLTKWIEAHPGGAENILILCGRDGTKEFTDQHGNNKEAVSRLSSFRIGTLR